MNSDNEAPANEKKPKVSCVTLPQLPDKLPSVELPVGGGKLSGLADFSSGSPSECTLTFSLLTQLAPLMANTASLMKILKVFKALEEFAKNPLANGPELLKSINDIKGLILSATLPAYGAAKSIKQTIELIISFLECFISQLKSNLELQTELNLGLKSAQDNSVLKAHLECAQNNAKASMKTLGMSIKPLEPLIESINMIGDIVDIPGFEKIDLSIDFSDNQDMEQVVGKIESLIKKLGDTIEAIPIS